MAQGDLDDIRRYLLEKVALSSQEVDDTIQILNKRLVRTWKVIQGAPEHELESLGLEYCVVTALKRRASIEHRDVTQAVIKCLTTPLPSIPSVYQLNPILQAPFAQKIPLTKYKTLAADPALCNVCLGDYFCESNNENGSAGDITILCDSSLVMQCAWGESSFISEYDATITRVWKPILETIPGATLVLDRNVIDSGATAKRPDLVLLLNSVLVAMREEKHDTEDIMLAEEELVGNLEKWDSALFGTMPYLLCYAAARHKLQWGAITPNLRFEPVSPEYSLDNTAHRVMHLVAVLNLCRVIATLLPTLPTDPPTFPLYHQLHLARNTTLCRLTPDTILKEIKEFQQYVADGYTSIDALCQVYEVVKREACSPFSIQAVEGPHVDDHRKRFLDEETVHSTYSVKTSPVCFKSRPQNEMEMKHAIGGILHVLKQLHAKRLVHRDIRWDTVMKYKKGWLLTDYEHAMYADKAPKIFLDHWPRDARVCYTCAADIYLVGRLILESDIFLQMSDVGRAFGRWLASEDSSARPTASMALADPWLRTAV